MFDNFHLPFRRVSGQVLPIYSQGAGGSGLNTVQTPAKRHLTERTVVSISLSISCKVDKPMTGRRGKEMVGEAVTVLEQVSECHLRAEGSILKKNRYLSTVLKAATTGLFRIAAAGSPGIL
jgi:hypothetical protein